ncbi:hypothetical protein ACFOEZ_19955 [Tianweitania populi]|uniref:Restriction endonuclease type IV Mrr domain-containing protein n=1 Tax=Tianweitania populi TaxID=1607949 RepID=A0A8J3DX45_9HYPH|nr:hypothetical protein [Tianweitania populi]GHD21331.1 hypothetical protein GCM10016234_34870 [Tianweitania populi]
MTSIHSLEIPKPKNWQDFEAITLDALRLRWGSPNLSANGRPGQKQKGVDIFGPDDIGRRIGAQCKRYAKPLKIEMVKAEVENSDAFEPALNAIYIATTRDRDTKLQMEVRMYSDKRVSEGKSAVGLLFWDDIVGSLGANPSTFKSHFPNFTLPEAHAFHRDRLLAALNLGYFGSHLWDYAELIHGEFGWMANTDPDEFQIVLSIVRQCSHSFLPASERDAVVASLDEIVAIMNTEEVLNRGDWEKIQTLSKRVSKRLVSLSSVPILESNTLEVGRRLGAINHVQDDEVGAAQSAELKRQVDAILPYECAKRTAKKFAEADKMEYSYGYRWAPKVFAYVEQEIRFANPMRR